MVSFSNKQKRVVTQQQLPLEVFPPIKPLNSQAVLPVVRIKIDEASPVFSFSLNPHMADLINVEADSACIELPYQSNISSGKNSYVYDAHTYHTKVPPEGIAQLIDYYTRPGDVVLDPFCGSGMTGVAAVEKGRKVLLSDISPAATFIAFNLTTPVNAARYLDAVQKILEATEDLEQRLYTTHCRTCGETVPILYMV